MNALSSAAATASQAPELSLIPTPRRALPWPVLALRLGSFAVELDGPLSGSLWLGRLDAFARWERESAWFWEREPGSVAVGAGWWRLTVSWAPVGG